MVGAVLCRTLFRTQTVEHGFSRLGTIVVRVLLQGLLLVVLEILFSFYIGVGTLVHLKQNGLVVFGISRVERIWRRWVEPLHQLVLIIVGVLMEDEVQRA